MLWIVGDTLATGVTPRDINDVDRSCMHIYVNDNVNAHVNSRTIWIVGEPLTNELVRGKAIPRRLTKVIKPSHAMTGLTNMKLNNRLRK